MVFLPEVSGTLALSAVARLPSTLLCRSENDFKTHGVHRRVWCAGKEKNKHKKPHNRPYLWRSRSTTRQCSFMSLFLAGGKSLIDNTCPQNRACSTCSISQAAPDHHKHPAENRTPPDASITTAGVSICRAALGTDTVRYTVTQEQRQPASLRRGGHSLFSTAGVPAVQHSTMRSRGTHVTSV